MAAYVLVHGGWDGGWAWKDVSRLLRAEGHEVYTPTLTGLGEREHLASPGIDLDTHITDIVKVFQYEVLWNAILVGHSYSGMVITGVAEQIPERIAHMVYLDAFVPEDGEALADVFDTSGAARTTWESMLARGIDALPQDEPRRVAQPIRTVLQPIALKSARAEAFERTYIFCTKGKDVPFYEFSHRSAERARARGWRYRELPTVHNAPWTMPVETAELFLEVAELVR